MGNRLRIGIVGTGFIANVVAKAIGEADGAQLIAVSSRTLEVARKFADSHGAETAFDSWQELTAWAGVEAIYVGTPTAVREEICLAAAMNGKHLLAEKPFASLPSLRRITSACRAGKVAFMDATHFVHHPRTARLKAEMPEMIGQSQVVHTTFFFPLMDRTNIRFNTNLEPTGALGDMAWYSMRAAVEFLPNTVLDRVEAYIQKDPVTNAVIRASGLLVFDDGATATWDVGYNVGVCIMDLDILGTQGMMALDDFVLDWSKGFPFDNPDHRLGFTFRTGMASPEEFRFIETPSEKSAQALMIEAFVNMVRNPDRTDLREASISTSEATQGLLDAIWEKTTRR